ncbi:MULTISPECIES: HAD family hydrolase [Paenalcaligenes]|uniref:HAD family phosphatase n=1 Tax=Paenalcaligenes hermetiae TaxID=1157987 RepID=A0ABP9M4P7_9BURK|nr:HAD family phosphatase [Paenalcaligenes sp.]
MSFQAIIFDCDGVLVDSEPIRLNLLRKMLADLGWTLSYAECQHLFLGKSTQEEIDYIQQHLGQKLDAEWIMAYTLRRNQALRQQVIAVPGIHSCLQILKKHWPEHLACASAAEKSKILLQLDKVGLSCYFQGKIFSGVDTPRNKPYPDVYLRAAEVMHTPATACAIIEDSVTGITAGVAAGATVFAYCPSSENPHPLLEAGAHYTFSQMQQLPDLLLRCTSKND